MSTPQSTPLHTLGVSPKAIYAGVVPAVLAGLAAVGSALVTTDWNTAETRTLLTGLAAAFVAGISAYIGKPGTVVPEANPATRADKVYQQPPQ